MQTFDFLGFLNIDKSKSLKGTSEQFKNDILNFIPNPFEFDAYGDAAATDEEAFTSRRRILQEDEDSTLCESNELMK